MTDEKPSDFDEMMREMFSIPTEGGYQQALACVLKYQERGMLTGPVFPGYDHLLAAREAIKDEIYNICPKVSE